MYRHFLTLFSLLVCLNIWANTQQVDYNLNERDKESIAKIRAKMQQIREKEGRPTVGLVLSGGGAKGAAHIGILRYLEEKHIPVDLITGASMGTLIGTLYCVGYTTDEMESMIREADWNTLIADKIPSYYYSIEKRKYDSSALLNLPFYRGIENEKINLGIPSSLVPGMNVENYFASALVGYASDDLDFADLDIPFGCIATNISDATCKTFLNGNLILAARSSMSIPAMFAPKIVDGKTLVDGGMIDNFPVSLAKQMGADIVIGVDLSTSLNLNEKKIEHIGSILGAIIDLAEKPNHKINNALCDFIFYPDVVKEFNMLSFDDKNIAEIIKRGYKSGEDAGPALDSVLTRRGLTPSEFYSKKRRHATNLQTHGVEISSFELVGITNEFDRKYIMGLMDFYHTRSVIDKEYLDDIVDRIYAKGAFDCVTYEVQGEAEPYALVIKCVPDKVHQLGLGLRLDTEEVATIDVHVGLNTHKLSGNKLDFYGRASANPQIKLHWALDLPKAPTLNASAKVRWATTNLLQMDAPNVTESERLSYFNTDARVYLSNFGGKIFNFSLGAAYDYYQLIDRFKLTTEPIICEGISKTMNNWKVFADIHVNTLDAQEYARKGVLFDLCYEFNIRPRMTHIASVKFLAPITFGTHIFTLTPGFYARAVFGQTYAKTPIFAKNCMGGELAGRYLDQQVQFTGLNTIVPCGNLMGILRLDARFLVHKNVYVSARVNYMASILDVESIKTKPNGWHNDIFGCGVESAYVSRYGIIKAVLSYNTKTNRPEFYLSLGKSF